MDGEINSQDIPDLIAMLRDKPDSDDKQMMMYELIGRLAGIRGFSTGGDPARALQLLDNVTIPSQRSQLLAIALTTLSASDPKQALSIFANLPPGALPQAYYADMFSRLAKQDPAGAMAVAASLPPGADRTNALQNIGIGLAAANPQAALDWASSLPPEDSVVLDSIVQNLARTDPTLATSYLDKVTDPSARDSTIEAISIEMATGKNADPAAALTWLSQVGTGTSYDIAVTNIFTGLTAPTDQVSIDGNGMTKSFHSFYKQDIPTAISLLNTVTDPLAHQAAITSIAGGWSKSDTQAALAWAQSLPEADATARTAALNTIVTAWASTNPAAAVAFVQNSPDPTAYLSSAPALAQTMATTNPDAALAFAQSLPAGTAQTQALSNALVVLAGSNFTAAWNDAASLPPSDGQNTIMTNLVGVEATKDPAQAANLLGKISDGSAQLQATSTLSSTWIKLDPQAFTTWLTTVPAGDVRDTAIAQLASSSQATKNPAGVLQWVNTVSNPLTKAALLKKLTVQSSDGNPSN